MRHVTCGVCLVNPDKDDGLVLSALEDRGASYGTLWFKLLFIGFLQPDGKNELAEYICSRCAARVEDAYELKLQCLKTSMFWCDKNTSQPLKDFNSNDISTEIPESERPLSTAPNNSPDLIKTTSIYQAGTPRIPEPERSTSIACINSPDIMETTSNDQAGPPRSLGSEQTTSIAPNHSPDLIQTTVIDQADSPTVPSILASAYDMFACVQKMSTTLKLNMSLLSEAIHFMENTISLLTVLFPLKEISEPVKKSVQSIRSEAESWKIRSSMVHDAANFVLQVSSHNILPGVMSRCCKGSPKQIQTDISERKPTLTGISCENSCSAVSSSPSNVLDETNLSSNTPSTPNSDSVEILSKNSSDSIEPSRSSDFAADEVHFVRRSFRSRVSVDHLVYWPSFRKQGTSSSKSSSRLRSSRKCVEQPKTSTEALDSLLLRRNADPNSHKQKAMKDEKWSIVSKKKASIDDTLKDEVEETAMKVEDEVGENLKPLSLSEGSLKKCRICHKTLSSNRNLQAHLKMHTGSSPFPCSYCSKSFSSGWNRAQHERVHTGIKPYVCDICQESFRYNVTLRHHKSKRHNIS
ncbi:Zinc finger protein 282 [Frankliniella fusca]|uniref:Zinc finger protein 282 n=1 Tax=Frankliniella fusca TaxID=407009 RepID=A0AAE1LH05_9NEOP|nr:Zinc finger protein 282 [Frankliniella fusca]